MTDLRISWDKESQFYYLVEEDAGGDELGVVAGPFPSKDEATGALATALDEKEDAELNAMLTVLNEKGPVVAAFCKAHPERARAIFDSYLAGITDPDERAKIEVAREYFTNPDFRERLTACLWAIADDAGQSFDDGPITDGLNYRKP